MLLNGLKICLIKNEKTNTMRYIILTLTIIINLNINAQTNVGILNEMVNYVNMYMDGTELNGLIMLEALNENNSALVYQYKVVDDLVANDFKNNRLNYKKSVVDQSPNELSKVAIEANLIIKWRYFYKNKIILEIVVFPDEWND